MKRIGLFLTCAACLSMAVAWAAGPVSVTSPEPFRLHGALVPVAGVPSWPVLPGDEIATDRAGASIRFADGSSVVLRQNSSARYESDGNRHVFRLLTGSMDVKSVPASTVSFYTNTNPLVASTGTVTTTGMTKSFLAPRAPNNPGPLPPPKRPPVSPR